TSRLQEEEGADVVRRTARSLAGQVKDRSSDTTVALAVLARRLSKDEIAALVGPPARRLAGRLGEEKDIGTFNGLRSTLEPLCPLLSEEDAVATARAMGAALARQTTISCRDDLRAL